MRRPDPDQFSFPLQRERRARSASVPFVCEDPATGRRWYGVGRMPNWVKAYKRAHFMYPVARVVTREEFEDLRRKVGELADAVTGLVEMRRAA